MIQVTMDMAFPRIRVGNISDMTTQPRGARVSVNAPVGTSIAINVKDSGILKVKFKYMRM